MQTYFHIGLFLFFVIMFFVLVTIGRALKSQPIVQRKLPVFFTFLIGTVMIISFFIPIKNPLYRHLEEFTSTWATIIMSFAITLGVANLLLINFNKIRKQAMGWIYNVVLLGGFLTMSYFGLTEGIGGSHFNFLFSYVYAPMNQTMFSILAFYVASAAFRAFRAKNSEATMLLIAAVIVMLGRVSMGSLVWAFIFKPIAWFSPEAYVHFLANYDVSQIAIYINNVFTTAGQRAILLGASLGYISFSLKILLGIERSYFGGDAS